MGEENQDTYGIQKFFEVKNRNFKFEHFSLSMKGGECGLLTVSPIPLPFESLVALFAFLTQLRITIALRYNLISFPYIMVTT